MFDVFFWGGWGGKTLEKIPEDYFQKIDICWLILVEFPNRRTLIFDDPYNVFEGFSFWRKIPAKRPSKEQQAPKNHQKNSKKHSKNEQKNAQKTRKKNEPLIA